MKKILKMLFVFLFVGIILLCVSAWSPWLDEDAARDKAIIYFEKYWKSANDGCYISCEDCGVVDVNKVAFGQLVTLQYKCGWAGDVIIKRNSNVFINLLGQINDNFDEI